MVTEDELMAAFAAALAEYEEATKVSEPTQHKRAVARKAAQEWLAERTVNARDALSAEPACTRRQPVTDPKPLNAELTPARILEIKDAEARNDRNYFVSREDLRSLCQMALEASQMRQALADALEWMEATNDYESLSPTGHALTRDQIKATRVVLGKRQG